VPVTLILCVSFLIVPELLLVCVSSLVFPLKDGAGLMFHQGEAGASTVSPEGDSARRHYKIRKEVG
jgi:hypothetical protein